MQPAMTVILRLSANVKVNVMLISEKVWSICGKVLICWFVTLTFDEAIQAIWRIELSFSTIAIVSILQIASSFCFTLSFVSILLCHLYLNCFVICS